MKDMQLPLIVAACVFALFVVWSVRPKLFRSHKAPLRGTLRDAQARIANARNESERATALTIAAEASVRTLGGNRRALDYYVRAMKANPGSKTVIESAKVALAHAPRSLETLLWRRLAAIEWSEVSADANALSTHTLIHLYATSLRNPVRAKALAHVLSAAGVHSHLNAGLGS